MNNEVENGAAPVAGGNNIKISVPKLDLSVDRYCAYKSWRSKWDDYVMLTELDKKGEAYQAAMLRYAFTDDTRQIYDSLQLSEVDSRNPAKILEEIEKFAKGIINETLERHTFYSRNQHEGEKFDEFLTDIVILSKNCNFCVDCHSGMIRDRIVGGVQNDELRRILLAEKDLTEEKAREKCRSYEKAVEGVASLHSKKPTAPVAELDRVGMGSNNTNNRNQNNRGRTMVRGGRGRGSYDSRSQSNRNSNRENMNDGNNSCLHCLKNHPKGRNNCPALGRQCNACRKHNHFVGSTLCSKSATHSVDEVQEELDVNMSALYIGSVDYLGSEESETNELAESKEQQGEIEIGTVRNSEEAVEETEVKRLKELEKVREIEVTTPKGSVNFKLDSGADVTVIGEEHLDQFGLQVTDLKPTRKKLKGADDKLIKCYGYFQTRLNTNKESAQTLIYVGKDVKKALLGVLAGIKLKLIQINVPERIYVGAVQQEGKQNIKVVSDFPKVFAGLGFFGDEVHIAMKDGAVPYHVNAPRRVSLPLMDPLQHELARMVKLKVIRKVNEPTDWCHPIVVIPKPKSKERLRVCLDLTKLNEQVKREFYELPSVPETLSKIGNKCRVMSKLDFNSGYWQMPLDESSQLKCTFTTPFGRYCPTRAPFGLCSLPEIFTKKLDDLLSELDGIVRSMDDILVHGETLEEHDQRLEKLLSVLDENGITLNLKKCIFRKSELEFLGHVVSAEVISPIHQRMEAVNAFPTPRNVKELKSFLGMAQYLSRFSPDLAKVSEPLRDLLSKKNVWNWEDSHTKAFNEVKSLLSDPICLATYDVHRETMVRTDGSKLNGIGVAVYQKQDDGKWRIIDCASRFLSDTEKNYYPIEIEMLAVMWGIKRMEMYLHGLPLFKIGTDHKPLVPILNYKPLGEMSPRIQAMRMKLLRYQFKAEHVPGKDMKDADAFSRYPTEQPTAEDRLKEEEVSIYMSAVSEHLPASDEKLEEIKSETAKDSILQQVIQVMEEGWPETRKQCIEAAKPYWDYRGDLSVCKGVVLCGEKIVVPKSMRADMLQRIHEGHLGMDKCKWRARQSICWPGMSKDIENMIHKCETCARLLASKPKEPMLSYDVPNRRWEMLGADLFEYAGKNYVVMVDYYSLWPEVYRLNKTRAIDVIEAFKQSMSRFGIPDRIYSDNGPQFKAHEYRTFLKKYKITRKTSSPYRPQSNGLAEAMVKVVKSLIKKCHRSNQDLAMGLMNLRNSPIRGMASPAQILLGHQIQDNLPSITKLRDQPVYSRDMQKTRLTSKQHYDKHVAQRSPQNFQANQRVAVQDVKTKEWSQKGRIIEETSPRSFVIELENGKKIRRNCQLIRKVYQISLSGR